MIRFCSYLSGIDQRTENATTEKHNRNIQFLARKHFWSMQSDREKHIQNFSDHTLFDTGKFVLYNGLDFFLPPKISTERRFLLKLKFCILRFPSICPFRQLNLLPSKPNLSDLARAFCGTPADLGDFNMHEGHFQVLISRSLSQNGQRIRGCNFRYKRLHKPSLLR